MNKKELTPADVIVTIITPQDEVELKGAPIDDQGKIEMNNLTWEQFVSNVQGWAKERGIYEHSTPTAQLLKTLSELGEVADAVIKNDREALADGIGDVAVCLVNYWTMMGGKLSDTQPIDIKKSLSPLDSRKAKLSCLSYMLEEISQLLHENEDYDLLLGPDFQDLYTIATVSDLDFMSCCTTAWEEIKDRKGRMVAGGAFVKESKNDK